MVCAGPNRTTLVVDTVYNHTVDVTITRATQRNHVIIIEEGLAISVVFKQSCMTKATVVHLQNTSMLFVISEA